MIRCPLCLCQKINQSSSLFLNNIKKTLEYFNCSTCDLLFMHPENALTIEDEKVRYESHNNDPSDHAYKNYLSQLWDLSLEFVKQGPLEVLDFGCGPSKGLESNFSSTKFNIDSYDPIFFKRFFNKKYDLIYASECFEHFNNPNVTIKNISKLLPVSSILAIRTEILTDDIDFKDWYYKNDPTHVCFYSKKTFNYIAAEYKLKLMHLSKNKIIYQK